MLIETIDMVVRNISSYPDRPPDKIWPKEPNRPEPHAWAFYYFLKDSDKYHVEIEKHGDKSDPITLFVWDL